jgi:hypothetical protein
MDKFVGGIQGVRILLSFSSPTSAPTYSSCLLCLVLGQLFCICPYPI